MSKKFVTTRERLVIAADEAQATFFAERGLAEAREKVIQAMEKFMEQSNLYYLDQNSYKKVQDALAALNAEPVAPPIEFRHESKG